MEYTEEPTPRRARVDFAETRWNSQWNNYTTSYWKCFATQRKSSQRKRIKTIKVKRKSWKVPGFMFCLQSGNEPMGFSFELPWRRLIRFLSVWLAHFRYKHNNTAWQSETKHITRSLFVRNSLWWNRNVRALFIANFFT